MLLAKNEEIFIPGLLSLLILMKSKRSSLLRRVRDEAHRFALSFHRDKRSKRMNRSNCPKSVD